MPEEPTAPPGIDVTIPNAARMYDYYLGGKDNFAADREAAEQVLAMAPAVRGLARRNRAFLRRAVRMITQMGIRQFLDIGTGLPSVGNVHEVAQAVDPRARVAYVDNDTVVLAHARALLSRARNTVTIDGDLRRPDAIVENPELRELFDFARPVAILLVAVLHFLTDEDRPREIVARLRDKVPPGSFLVLSHATASERDSPAQRAAAVYRHANASVTLRAKERISELFEGFELLSPGLVELHEWHPDGDLARARFLRRPLPAWMLCGVARKP